MASEFFRPSSDITITGWSTTGTGTGRYGRINESTQNNANLVKVIAGPSTRNLVMGMSGTAPSGTITGATIRIAVANLGYLGAYVDLGPSRRIEVILNGVTYSEILFRDADGTWRVYERTLSQAAAQALNLGSLQITVRYSGSSTSFYEVGVSWLEVEINHEDATDDSEGFFMFF